MDPIESAGISKFDARNSIRVACLEEPVLNSPPYVVIDKSALVRAFEVLRSLRDLVGKPVTPQPRRSLSQHGVIDQAAAV